MQKLTHKDLFTLEKYAAMRDEFRARIMQHKKNRRLAIGPNISLYFEDHLLMHYQIQEMLRAERIFEIDAIEEELATYNPLIPDGHNWKATFMIEYPDEHERHQALIRLKGIENKIWLRVAGHEIIHPVADEDLERENDEKTSAVHFLRFELNPAMIKTLKKEAHLSAGVNHPAYQYRIESIAQSIVDSLIADLD